MAIASTSTCRTRIHRPGDGCHRFNFRMSCSSKVRWAGTSSIRIGLLEYPDRGAAVRRFDFGLAASFPERVVGPRQVADVIVPQPHDQRDVLRPADAVGDDAAARKIVEL